MLFPQERTLNQVVRETSRDMLLERLLLLGPRTVYGGLLWYAQFRHWKPGWAAYAFKEIFGVWPRDGDREKAVPICIVGTDIEEWCWRRKRKGK